MHAGKFLDNPPGLGVLVSIDLAVFVPVSFKELERVRCCRPHHEFSQELALVAFTEAAAIVPYLLDEFSILG